MLKQYIDNSRTDKNTTHSYLEVYEPFLSQIRDSAKNVLEIGINFGGGLDLFHKYFKNATIYGLENQRYEPILDDLKMSTRVHMFHNTDAYTSNCIQMFKNQQIQFDFILDDGPHSIESQLYVVKEYIHLLTEKGILIIEDIQSYDSAQRLVNALPENLRRAAYIIDRRSVKNRYDDVVFIFDKHYL